MFILKDLGKGEEDPGSVIHCSSSTLNWKIGKDIEDLSKKMFRPALGG
jgi:hypothetical protein